MLRLRQSVYLDNNATTPVAEAVQRRMASVLKRTYGNPSSLHNVARDAAAILEESRAAVAAAIHADPHQVLFVSCASEANNQILKTMAGLASPARPKIVATPVEHASVAQTLAYLATQGVAVEYVAVNRLGQVDHDDLARRVDARTLLVCVLYANNETGTLQDIPRIAALAHEQGALMFSDCVQALGKVPVDVQALGLDYATFSAHKIHGPKGIGALYTREGCPLQPLLHGGHQESGLRAGTESLHNIAGFAAAALRVPALVAAGPRVRALRDQLLAGLRDLKPDLGLNSPAGDACLPNTLNVTFPGHSNALLQAALDSLGISVSAGSACNTQSDEPSHVLTAIGLTPAEARQTLRFSLSGETSARDIRYALRALADIVQGRLPPVQAVSPGQVDEKYLLDPDLYILDVRFWHDRKALRGLPNSHEASYVSIRRYVRSLPRNRRILVVCQVGYNAPVVAYYLQARGFRNVSFLLSGLLPWRVLFPDLYARLAGRNVVKLEPS